MTSLVSAVMLSGMLLLGRAHDATPPAAGRSTHQGDRARYAARILRQHRALDFPALAAASTVMIGRERARSKRAFHV